MGVQGRLIDMAGQVIGRLTVLRRHGRTPDKSATWFCQCACGAKVIATGNQLRRRDKQSCGCLHRDVCRARAVDLLHKRFGRLKVIKRGESVNKYLTWWCLCDCGWVGRVRGRSLRTGKTQSCGCLRRGPGRLRSAA